MKKHVDRDLIFEKKRQEALEKNQVVNLLELLQVKKVTMQTMKLVEYKPLSVNLEKAIKKIKQKVKRTRRQNKRIKTSINKSKCLKWIVKKKILPTL